MIYSNDISIVLIGLCMSFFLSLLIAVAFKAFKIGDPSLIEKRAAHSQPTARLGGFSAIIAVLLALYYSQANFDWYLCFSLLPVFLIGLAEDLNLPTPPRARLMFGALSAGLFIYGKGIWLNHINVPGSDLGLSNPVIGIGFTIFALVGIVNAINLMDGINGLASGKIIIATAAIFYLASEYNEPQIRFLSLAILSASMGLFLLNFPIGRIFLGDAGAYSFGLLIGICLVTLKFKHPEISGWALLLIVFWPVMDTLHSMMRRQLSNKASGRPDMMHMHHIIMRGLEVASRRNFPRRFTNPLATVIILPIAALPVLIGSVLSENSQVLFFVTGLYAVCFLGLYVGLIKLIKSRKIYKVMTRYR